MGAGGRGLLMGSLLALMACGPRISGTWEDAGGMTTYEFGPDGKASVSVLDTRVAAEYTLDGDKVLVTSPQGTVVLTRRDDHLYGPMGQVLVRRH